jgi:hypothetical protein
MKSQPSVRLSSSQSLFTFLFLIFFFTLLNGYALNLVAEYRANAWLVLAGVIVEMIAALWFARGRVSIQRDPLELAGFLIVAVGVWLYFVIPSLPTLLPPTQSNDAVRVYLQVLFSYPEGRLVSWYPAGGAFLAAMFSHWLGWQPLRALHPTAASFVALSAGAVYGMTCALLPRRRVSKMAALFAPALLFVPWSYFAGILLFEQYFYAQALAQLFVLAALWYTASYAEQPHAVFAALLGAALLGIVSAYPIFVALPLATFALEVIVQVWRARHRAALVALAAFVALMLAAAVVLQQGGILELRAGQISTTSDVGAGGVTNPSLETLGGPIFLALALIGIPFAWRARAFGRTMLAFLFAWALQLVALVVVQPFLQISGYRVDKTFYILIFALALIAALPLAFAIERFAARVAVAHHVAAFAAMVVLLSIGVIGLRPPKFFAPFSEAELQTAFWAKKNLETYQVHSLDPSSLRAYWLAFGLWRETLPNEWFQWIPAGTKLGPRTFAEWLRDPDWSEWLWVSDVRAQSIAPARVIYQNGNSAIVQKNSSPPATAWPMHPLSLYFGSTIRLIGYDLPRTTFAPGETITLTTYTESIYPPSATVGWRAELLTRDGTVVSQAAGDPFANKFPVQRWSPGRIARDLWLLPIDANAPPGIYAVQLGLYRRVDGDFVDVHTLPDPYALQQQHWSAAPLTQIKIPLRPPSADELRAATPLRARVGESFLLSHYALRTDAATRVAHLTLYWQSVAKTEKNYTVFVHLLDSNGKIIAQKDAPPARGDYPTSIWDAQEIVTDSYELAIPADARAPLSLAIGMYEQPGLKRLPIGNDDKIILDLRF